MACYRLLSNDMDLTEKERQWLKTLMNIFEVIAMESVQRRLFL